MRCDDKIDPGLKHWLDCVVVPILVKNYIEICCVEGDNNSSPALSRDADDSTPEHVQ
jgi:hypothetical protein